MSRNRTCEERVDEAMASRMEDLRRLWELYQCDTEASYDDLGNIYEYGLCFDYVAPGTFTGQKEPYFRYQLSTGGPGDEFRIYASKTGGWSFVAYRIEYWSLDWWDGASRVLEGEEFDLIDEIFSELFADSETALSAYEAAMED